MTSFAELTKQVHLIKDLILSDMTYCDDVSEEAVIFSKHLLATKYWFTRVSYANKKHYLLALLQDVRSIWTLSLLLKSIWNCRLKDAVMSQSESGALLSSYDQVPMDHNRTALPITTLAQVMKSDRIWFLSLTPEFQVLVLAELLTIAGGPAMWEVLGRARTLYERYREHMIQNILECIVVTDEHKSKSKTAQLLTEKGAKKDQTSTTSPATTTDVNASQTQAKKDLEANLATWNAIIQVMRDSLKLEEIEMIFLDGTKRKIWKVNRTKPDVMETLDFLQLLPSSIGKKILSFLPRSNLADYARVNKYWAYLVDEYRTEIAARIKINADIERLNAILLKHDEAMKEYVVQNELPITSDHTCCNTQHLNKVTQSLRASEKSAGAYSFRYFTEKLNKPVIKPTPIRNMKDFYERLEIRGAADENIWKWCENIIRSTKVVQKHSLKKSKKQKEKNQEQQSNPQELRKEGVLPMGDTYFSCPLMKTTLQIPLKPPLYEDPAKINPTLIKKLSHPVIDLPRGDKVRRFSLWSRNLSSLYPVFKIPSYQFPSV